jgi:hypothetical protein
LAGKENKLFLYHKIGTKIRGQSERGCVDQTESDRTGQLFSLFYLTKRKQHLKKRSKLCFYATELVKKRYKKVSVRVVVDLSTSIFRKAVIISVGSFLVCTQLRLDTLHYNKLKAKKSDTGEIVVLSIAPRLRDRTEWCANMYKTHSSHFLLKVAARAQVVENNRRSS